MALMNCPECEAEISQTAMDCPKCGVQLRKPKRGFFGVIFKWTFILFNVLMVAWLASYWGTVAEITTATSSGAEQAGAAIGATLGTGMLFSIWVFGDIILGMFVLFTRPSR